MTTYYVGSTSGVGRRLLAIAMATVFSIAAIDAMAILPDEKSGSPPTSGKPKAAPGKLIIETDAVCDLYLDGEKKPLLHPGAPEAFSVSAGETLIECESAELPGTRVKEVKKVDPGSKVVVALSLRYAVTDRRASEARAAEAAAQAAEKRRHEELEARRRKALEDRYSDQGSGVVRDMQTGLNWTQSDNGSEIDWNEASSWCTRKGSGWRLPTSDELLSLYDKSRTIRTECGRLGPCKVSPLFELTKHYFWTNEREGARNAWLVSLAWGDRSAQEEINLNLFGDARALCVRRS